MTLYTGPASVDAPELLSLVRDASNLRDARDALAEDVLGARLVGHTWREIAQAVGMTEHGVAALHRRTTEQRDRDARTLTERLHP